jgi:hypothetical protein
VLSDLLRFSRRCHVEDNDDVGEGDEDSAALARVSVGSSSLAFLRGEVELASDFLLTIFIFIFKETTSKTSKSKLVFLLLVCCLN